MGNEIPVDRAVAQVQVVNANDDPFSSSLEPGSKRSCSSIATRGMPRREDLRRGQLRHGNPVESTR